MHKWSLRTRVHKEASLYPIKFVKVLQMLDLRFYALPGVSKIHKPGASCDDISELPLMHIACKTSVWNINCVIRHNMTFYQRHVAVSLTRMIGADKRLQNVHFMFSLERLVIMIVSFEHAISHAKVKSSPFLQKCPDCSVKPTHHHTIHFLYLCLF